MKKADKVTVGSLFDSLTSLLHELDSVVEEKRKAHKEETTSPLHIRIGKQFKHELKVYCAENDMTINEFVLESLVKNLREKTKTDK